MAGSIRIQCTQEQADRWKDAYHKNKRAQNHWYKQRISPEIQAKAKEAKELYQKTGSRRATIRTLGIGYATLDKYLKMEVA